MDVTVNYFMVLVAALASFGIGGLWYSPVLFQKRWTRLTKRAESDIPPMVTATQAMLAEFALSLLTAFVLAHLIVLVDADTFGLALQLGFWLWAGFQAPMLFTNVIFGKHSLELFAINASQRLVAILVMSSILGLWQ